MARGDTKELITFDTQQTIYDNNSVHEEFELAANFSKGDSISINSDGDVGSPVITKSLSTGSSVNVSSTSGYRVSAYRYFESAYDSDNGKILFIWAEANTAWTLQRIYYRVGTVSGTTVNSLGSKTLKYSHASNLSAWMNAGYDPVNSKFFVVYHGGEGGNASGAASIVGYSATLSGTTLTWSSAVTLQSSINVNGIDMCWDSSAERFVITWVDRTNNIIRARNVSLSGTNPSMGTLYSLKSASAVDGANCAYDETAERVLFAYHAGTSYSTIYAYAKAASVSGGTITFGNEVLPYGSSYSLNTPNRVLSYFKEENKFTYLTVNTSSISYVNSMSISGTTTSVGTRTSTGMLISPGRTVYSEFGSCGIIGFGNGSGTIKYYKKITFSGATPVISGTTTLVDNSSTITYGFSDMGITNLIDSDGKIAFFYVKDDYDPIIVSTIILQLSGSSFSYADVSGIMNESGTTGQTKKVSLIDRPHFDSGHTGLTSGAKEYAQSDGSLGETITDNPIGRNVSGTELIVTKNP